MSVQTHARIGRGVSCRVSVLWAYQSLTFGNRCQERYAFCRKWLTGTTKPLGKTNKH